MKSAHPRASAPLGDVNGSVQSVLCAHHALFPSRPIRLWAKHFYEMDLWRRRAVAIRKQEVDAVPFGRNYADANGPVAMSGRRASQ